MPNLIKIETKEYPVSVNEFKRRFPNVSFGAQINFEEFGYAVVFDTPRPSCTRLQRVKEIDPQISIKGNWEQVWKVVNLEDEMSAEEYSDYVAALLTSLKANKLVILAAYRYEKESAGIIVDGVDVHTDRSSRSILNSKKDWLANHPSQVVDYKGKNGWHDLTKQKVEDIWDEVETHVESCYNIERTHAEAIEALTTVNDVEQYDITTGWPE